MSSTSIDVTLWGILERKEGNQIYQQYEQHQETMIVVKNGRISHYNGKVVTTSTATTLAVDPNIEEAQKIWDWYDRIGGSLQTNTP